MSGIIKEGRSPDEIGYDEGGAFLIDRVEQGGKWKFDKEVASSFDNMLERSIPQYEVMRDAVTEMGSKVIESSSAKTPYIVDLGTSRGRAVEGLVKRYGAKSHFVLCEISKPMLAAVRSEFGGYIDADVIEVREMDLRTDFPSVPASLFLSVLTLQFVPINYRQTILQNVYDTLLPGGGFILVEKVLGEGALIDSWMVDIYHDRKQSMGYSYDSIDRKRESLEGSLVPLTADWNQASLEKAGFKSVDCFWRWMNFAAWVAIK